MTGSGTALPSSSSTPLVPALAPLQLISAKDLAGAHQLADPGTWFAQLAGLRVLVVHPFASTIERQYAKGGAALFPGNPTALPHFGALLTYRPVQNIQQAESTEAWYSPWRPMLEAMKADLAELAPHFDVALLACGGWGHPLVHFLRHDLNRSAVYVGGALQLHFGILGARYRRDAAVQALVNGAWVWPSDEETAGGTLKAGGYFR